MTPRGALTRTIARRRGRAGRTGFLAALLLLGPAACRQGPILMDAPTIYASGDIDPYADDPPDHRTTSLEIFYATDRAVGDRPGHRRYTEARGHELILGVATARIGPESMAFDEVHAEAISTRRTSILPVSTTAVEEIGVLRESMFFLDDRYDAPGAHDGERAWVEAIDERLRESQYPDIMLFVAPFKVDFQYGIAVAAEYAHFLGRGGVFMAYSWPTETGALSYFSATENAYYTARNLRELLELLASSSGARRIHIMTYSAGARVVAYALHGLRLKYHHLDKAELKSTLRLGQVVYAGPDMDSNLFAMQLNDGVADLADQTTIYTTTRDRALGMSKLIFGWTRLGSLDPSAWTDEQIGWLRDLDNANVQMVDVSNTEGIELGNSHSYFRSSPWASSDIVMTLAFGLQPEARGLARSVDSPIWVFPDDYPDRLHAISRPIADGRPPVETETGYAEPVPVVPAGATVGPGITAPGAEATDGP